MNDLNNYEKLESICNMAYEAIESLNEEAILAVKNRIPKILKDFRKIIINEFLTLHGKQIYDLLTINRIQFEVDHNNIQILAEEIRILFNLCLKTARFKKSEKQIIIILFIKIAEILNKIDCSRKAYIKENSNEGRTATSNYQIRNIEKYLETTDALEEELKRNLKQ